MLEEHDINNNPPEISQDDSDVLLHSSHNYLEVVLRPLLVSRLPALNVVFASFKCFELSLYTPVRYF